MRLQKTIVVAMLFLGSAATARAENWESLVAEYIGLMEDEQALFFEITMLEIKIDDLSLSRAKLETKTRLLAAALAYDALTPAEQNSIYAQIKSLNSTINALKEGIAKAKASIASLDEELDAVGDRLDEIEYIMDNR